MDDPKRGSSALAALLGVPESLIESNYEDVVAPAIDRLREEVLRTVKPSMIIEQLLEAIEQGDDADRAEVATLARILLPTLGTSVPADGQYVIVDRSGAVRKDDKGDYAVISTSFTDRDEAQSASDAWDEKGGDCYVALVVSQADAETALEAK